MLLEVHFVEGPQLYRSSGHQRLELSAFTEDCRFTAFWIRSTTMITFGGRWGFQKTTQETARSCTAIGTMASLTLMDQSAVYRNEPHMRD